MFVIHQKRIKKQSFFEKKGYYNMEEILNYEYFKYYDNWIHFQDYYCRFHGDINYIIPFFKKEVLVVIDDIVYTNNYPLTKEGKRRLNKLVKRGNLNPHFSIRYCYSYGEHLEKEGVREYFPNPEVINKIDYDFSF